MAVTNPFPGMNPYLEGRWGDFHASLIGYIRDAIQDGLPGDLRARMQDRVFIERTGGPNQSFYPDAHVYRPPAHLAQSAYGGEAAGASEAFAGSTATAVMDEPVVVQLPPAERTERYIEIIDAGSGGQVVTTIEVLSPSNKRPGRGRIRYLAKQDTNREGGVNLVEIDLLRGGRWTTLVPASAARFAVGADRFNRCHVSVHRAARPGEIEVYPAPLRRRLPTIRVPLRATDADAPLDLQSLVDWCHRRGRYDDIDYAVGPQPPLEPADAAWAEDVLKQKALR